MLILVPSVSINARLENFRKGDRFESAMYHESLRQKARQVIVKVNPKVEIRQCAEGRKVTRHCAKNNSLKQKSETINSETINTNTR